MKTWSFFFNLVRLDSSSHSIFTGQCQSNWLKGFLIDFFSVAWFNNLLIFAHAQSFNWPLVNSPICFLASTSPLRSSLTKKSSLLSTVTLPPWASFPLLTRRYSLWQSCEPSRCDWRACVHKCRRRRWEASPTPRQTHHSPFEGLWRWHRLPPSDCSCKIRLGFRLERSYGPRGLPSTMNKPLFHPPQRTAN